MAEVFSNFALTSENEAPQLVALFNAMFSRQSVFSLNILVATGRVETLPRFYVFSRIATSWPDSCLHMYC